MKRRNPITPAGWIGLACAAAISFAALRVAFGA